MIYVKEVDVPKTKTRKNFIKNNLEFSILCKFLKI